MPGPRQAIAPGDTAPIGSCWMPLRLEGLLERYVQDLNPRDPGPGRPREFARHADTRRIIYDIDPGLWAAALNHPNR